VDGDTRRVHAGRERLLDRVPAREAREKRRVDVDDPVREALQERLREQLHEAGADDEGDAAPLEPVGHRPVALLSGAVGLQRERLCLDARCPGTLERARFRTAGGDGDHGQPRVEEGLEVRPLAGDQDADQSASTLPMTRPSPGFGTIAT
jgi:hypothetical protein